METRAKFTLYALDAGLRGPAAHQLGNAFSPGQRAAGSCCVVQ
jgi:hypothetical protein